MKILIGVLLIIHGLIVSAQSSGSFNPTNGVVNPAWLSWWPTNLGQSWLLTWMGAERTLIARAGGFFWLAAGLLLISAGLGVFGWIVPGIWWRGLALSGAVISLVMLALYLHPFLGIGVGASLIVLCGLLWNPGQWLEQLGL